MYGMWFPPEMMAQLQAQQEAEAGKTAAAKKAEAEAEAKKSPEEKLFEAKENVRIAGERYCSRILGMFDREIGKLVDQFPDTLDGQEKLVKQILWKAFLSELDVALTERKVRRPQWAKGAKK